MGTSTVPPQKLVVLQPEPWKPTFLPEIKAVKAVETNISLPAILCGIYTLKVEVQPSRFCTAPDIYRLTAPFSCVKYFVISTPEPDSDVMYLADESDGTKSKIIIKSCTFS